MCLLFSPQLIQQDELEGLQLLDVFDAVVGEAQLVEPVAPLILEGAIYATPRPLGLDEDDLATW